jgi:hypothetical protein
MGKDDVLEILRDYKINNAEKYGIPAIGIFGFMARGEARNDSDIDVCVKVDTHNPFVVLHIKNDLESVFKRHVDIVRLREKMNPFLKERIEKEGLYA